MREDDLAEFVIARYDLRGENKGEISDVTVGEIISLAMQFQWGTDKVDRMNHLLDTIETKSIGSLALAYSYAHIDHRS